MTNLIQQKLTAAAYIDYENIIGLLKTHFSVNPLELNFFGVILDRLRNHYQLNIIEIKAFCNFERKELQGRHQSLLQWMGVQTRHTANNGKNSGDLELTADALRSLYKNPAIEVFVVISSDGDIIPLLKSIKYENKKTYVISCRIGFNGSISNYADLQEYVEDIFKLEKPATTDGEFLELGSINGDPTYLDLERCEELIDLLFASIMWKNHETEGYPVTIKGFSEAVSRRVQRDPSQIVKDLQLAHRLGLIEIYQHPKGYCLRRPGEPPENQS
jgi:uncharacterized LabA/DUF88 family protein